MLAWRTNLALLRFILVFYVFGYREESVDFIAGVYLVNGSSLINLSKDFFSMIFDRMLLLTSTRVLRNGPTLVYSGKTCKEALHVVWYQSFLFPVSAKLIWSVRGAFLHIAAISEPPGPCLGKVPSRKMDVVLHHIPKVLD